MEKRLAVVSIIVTDRHSVEKLNAVLTEYGDKILGRLGLPLHDRHVNVIVIVVDADTDTLGAITGRIGRLDGVLVKSLVNKNPEQLK
jgi:putative iron-only hydrogenase system regulator